LSSHLCIQKADYHLNGVLKNHVEIDQLVSG